MSGRRSRRRPRRSKVCGWAAAIALFPASCGSRPAATDPAPAEPVQVPTPAPAAAGSPLEGSRDGRDPAAASPGRRSHAPAGTDVPCRELAFETAVHVAGAARSTTRGENRWSAAFEGAPAVDAELSEPYFAVERGDGAIFVADKNAHGIRRVTLDGTIHTYAGTNRPGNGPDGPNPPTEVALSHPNGLALAPDGGLFVLDLDNAKVRRVSSDGTRIVTVLRGDDFGKGRGLALHGRTLYVAAGTRLLAGSPGGNAPGLVHVVRDGFVSLGNLLVEPDGTLLAADRGGDQVLRLPPDGTVRPFLGSRRAGSTNGAARPAEFVPTDGPRSIVRLAPGRHLVAEHEGGRIFCVENGRARVLLRRDAPDTLPAWNGPPLGPMRGLSRAPDGSLLLVHGDAGAVHRIHLARRAR